MTFYWLQPGWTSTRCSCGKKIWPEGDPDWGMCYECMCASHQQEDPGPEQYPYSPLCDICGKHEAVTGVNGFGVCSEYCTHEAERKGGDRGA